MTISHPHHFLICLAKAACCEESPESPQQRQAEQWLSHEPTQEWAHLGHLVHSVHIAGFCIQQGHCREQPLPSVTKDWFPEHLHKRLIDLIGNSRRSKAKEKAQLLAKCVLHSSWPSWPAGDCKVLVVDCRPPSPNNSKQWILSETVHLSIWTSHTQKSQMSQMFLYILYIKIYKTCPNLIRPAKCANINWAWKVFSKSASEKPWKPRREAPVTGRPCQRTPRRAAGLQLWHGWREALATENQRYTATYWILWCCMYMCI